MKMQHIHFDEISSTHQHAIQNGLKYSDFTIITSDFQTDGRGRFGRSWQSSKNNSLLMSIILKPKIKIEQAVLITPVLSLVICDVLKTLKIESSIRWPNDIVIKGKKIAGVLSEASFGNELDFVVASCGINLNQDEDELNKIDRPATSVFKETGKKIDSLELSKILLKLFKKSYEDFLKNGFEAFFKQWVSKMNMINQNVLINLGKRVVDGYVTGFHKDGSIEVCDKDKTIHILHAGEVLRVGDVSVQNKQ